MGKTGSTIYIKILNNKGGFRWIQKAFLKYKKVLPKFRFRTGYRNRKMVRSLRSNKLNGEF